MTTITQDVSDIAGADDNTSWTFYTKEIRESGIGDDIITTRKVRKYPVAGVLTVELDPGPAVVIAPGEKHYPFTVPEEDSELWPLIQAAVTIPPTTQHQQLIDAVDAWLASHTDVWENIPDKPAVIAAGATQAEAWAALGVAPSTSLPSYVDDVLEFANLAAFPATGEIGKIYLALDTNRGYRWTGFTYLRITDAETVSDLDPRLDDNRAPIDDSVTLAKLNSAIRTQVDNLDSLYFTTATTGILNADNNTNSTLKVNRFGVPHYTNTEEPFYGLRMRSDATVNELQVGGGSTQGNAATYLSFLTAANNTTTVGTEWLSVDSTGLLAHRGLANLQGDTTVGVNTGGARIFAINAPAGQSRTLRFLSGGSQRWGWRTNATAEAGSDVGSDLELFSCTDAGAEKTILATFTRSSGAITLAGLLATAASASGGAGLRLPHGAAPSSPTNGDLWTTTAGIFARINGVTVELDALAGVTLNQSTSFLSYNTSDQTTNYERTRFSWATNVFTIAAENGGSGTNRPIAIVSNGKTETIGNSALGWFDFASGTTGVATPTVRISGTAQQASGAANLLSIITTINQSGTASYTGLHVNLTESALGSGAHNFADFLIAGVSKFKVDNGGTTTWADAANLIFGTTTGTKIGTATAQKLGFWNATPVVQPTAVADATDAASAITQLNALLARMRTTGLIAT